MHTLNDILYSISAANVADTLIMACLIYFILAWLKGRRAFQILATVTGMGAFYFLASSLGLVMTSVMFQYLWAAIIIVLAIVFQPEIRDLLEQASPIRYLSGRAARPMDGGIVEETVKAVEELARFRVGALIVFRRRNGLGNLILTGKDLDSLVSSETLLMIFQKGSPLHDGAVLVKHDRLAAAGCILPLSKNENIAGRYGTRHRAALGLTERCDALCVVVSEERGEVSIVEGDQISVYKRKTEFREALERGIMHGDSSEPVRRGLTDLVTSNWGLKLLSIGMAVLLWFAIVGPQKSEIGMQVPIQYTDLPQGMEITGTWVDRIDVRARGSVAGLAHLKPGSVKAVVDLSKVVPGLNYFRISDKNLSVPAGVTIAQVRPSDLRLHIAATSTMQVKVFPNILGTAPVEGTVIVTPDTVTVRGLRSDLQQVVSAVTDPVKITELLEKKKLVVPVLIKPEGLRIDGIDPIRVTVSIDTKKQ